MIMWIMMAGQVRTFSIGLIVSGKGVITQVNDVILCAGCTMTRPSGALVASSHRDITKTLPMEYTWAL